MLRRTVACLGLITALFFASNAQAQFSQYYLPIERGVLKSKIELQAQYSSIGDFDAMFFSLAGAYNFGRLQVGVNIPFAKGWEGDGDFQFGDVRFDLKAKVFSLSDVFGLAVFANLYAPTHSGDKTHSYFRLQTGAAANARLLGFEVGGGLEAIGNIVGDNQDDDWLVGLWGLARVPILGLLAVQVAVEYFNSLHPNGDINAFFVTPGVEVALLGLHLGVGSRIAVTENAKSLGLGRASLLINAGYSW